MPELGAATSRDTAARAATWPRSRRCRRRRSFDPVRRSRSRAGCRRAWRRRAGGRLAISSRNDAAGATAASASRSATPATKPSVAATAGCHGSFRRRLASRLPGAAAQLRPRRPRPGGLARDTTQSPPGSPCPAERHRLVVRRADAVEALDPVARRFSARGETKPHPLRTASGAAAAAAPTSGAGTIQNRRITALARPSTTFSAGVIGSKARARLVEIHDLDDAQVVIGADHARHDADHGERHEPASIAAREDVELGEEAGERRNAGEREHHHREAEGHHRDACGAGPERSSMFST